MAYLEGTSEGERINGTNGYDDIYGKGGDDEIFGLGFGDDIFGGAGDDVLVGDGGRDDIYGGAGVDYVNGGPGNDGIFSAEFIEAGPGDDYIEPGVYDWVPIWTGAGDDTVVLKGWGSAEYLTLSLNYEQRADNPNAEGPFPSRIKAVGGVSRITVQKFYDDESETDTDTIKGLKQLGDTNGLQLNTTAGDDIVKIRFEGESYLDIYDRGGNDLYVGGVIDGGGHNRVSYTDWGEGGIDVMVTGFGAGMEGTVTDADGGVDSFRNIDDIQGTDDDDIFMGAFGDDRFIPRAGDDVVNGKGGFDYVRYDRRYVKVIDADLAKNRVTETTTDDEVFTDTIRNVERIRGSRGGDDVIKGSKAGEQLEGRGGNDKLFGRGGKDVLVGEDGNDLLVGGNARDVFRFDGDDGRDVVRDWQDGLDRLELDVAGFEDLTFRTKGDDVVLRFGDTTVVFKGEQKSSFTADDIDFLG